MIFFVCYILRIMLNVCLFSLGFILRKSDWNEQQFLSRIGSRQQASTPTEWFLSTVNISRSILLFWILRKVVAHQKANVYSDARKLEYLSWRIVLWNVSEELVSVLVPLNSIQRLSSKFVFALEVSVLVANRVLWNFNFEKSQRLNSCEK